MAAPGRRPEVALTGLISWVSRDGEALSVVGAEIGPVPTARVNAVLDALEALIARRR